MKPVAVVTGAGRGIGRVIALAFAAAGYDLALAARHRPPLEETARLAAASGAEGLVITADVAQRGQVEEMAGLVRERFGRVDALVNNSGIAGPSAPLWEVDADAWDETFAVNVRGVFLVTRSLIPMMLEQGSGSVIVIGSISGKRPLAGRSPYAASKLALVGLVRTLALEAGPHGVRVNLISPGFVSGPRIEWVIEAQAKERGMSLEEARAEFDAASPLGRFTEPQDVAQGCVFLASDAAAAITGIDLNVNAGVVMY